MITTAAGVLVASLVGSVHCAGMCGGFVCFYAGSAKGNEPAALRAHAMYNVGRLASYLLLGAVAGALGVGVSKVGSLVGIRVCSSRGLCSAKNPAGRVVSSVSFNMV